MASLNHHRVQDTLIREIQAYLAFWLIAHESNMSLRERISAYGRVTSDPR